MPYPNYHSARVEEPSSFLSESFRTHEIAPGITIILGKKKKGGSMETLAYRFAKEKFTAEKARKWLTDHEIAFISFEKAVGNLVEIDNTGIFDHKNGHEAILQRLETWLPFPHPDLVPGQKLFYASDNFAGTELDWQKGKRLVFVPEGQKVQHVDHAAFADDPEGEARRLGFRLAGTVTDVKVVRDGPGEPRVTGNLVIDDAEAEELAKTGGLSISTGFDAAISPDGTMSGRIVPNHILLFPRCGIGAGETCGTPNDGFAMVQNLREGNIGVDNLVGTVPQNPSGFGIGPDSAMELGGHKSAVESHLNAHLEEIKKKQEVKHLMEMDEESRGFLKIIHDTVAGTAKAETANLKLTVDNLSKTIEAKDKEYAGLKKQVDNLTAQIVAKDKELDEFRAAKAEQEKKALDLRWQEVKNLYKPALFHGDGKEATQRALYDNDPVKFMMDNVGNLKTEKERKAPVGNPMAVGNLGEQQVDIVNERGKYNSKTHRWE
jgi:hypothetical protein